MLRQAQTRYGTLQGVPCGDPRVTVFKGVPYAKPPVGAAALAASAAGGAVGRRAHGGSLPAHRMAGSAGR